MKKKNNKSKYYEFLHQLVNYNFNNCFTYYIIFLLLMNKKYSLKFRKNQFYKKNNYLP